MIGTRPLAAGDAVRIISGGSTALDELTARIGRAPHERLAMQAFQMDDPAFVAALGERARTGGPIDLLADARLADGSATVAVHDAVRGSGGALRTYGDGAGDWFQHGKTFHFVGTHGTETWVTNLAPIPDTRIRTEISLITRGDAADAAAALGAAELRGDRAAVLAASEAGRTAGFLSNAPLHDVRHLTDAIHDVFAAPPARDLLVVTKGLEDARATDAIVRAHRAGRDVQVFVRDIARADAERLDAAGVPTWVVSGGAKPRVNAYFAGDRGVIGSAFLWDNMTGPRAGATSRDLGVLVDGTVGSAVRDASLASSTVGHTLTPLAEHVRAGDLPEHV